MKLRKIVSLLSLLLVLVMVLPAVVACGKKAETPEQQFSGSMNKTAEKVREWDEVKLAQKVMNGGSARLQFTVPKDEDVAVDTDLDCTVYFDNANKKYALNASVTADGKTDAASAWVSKDAVVLNSADLLGGAYGVNLETLAAQLENSIFAPGKSEMSMDEETYAFFKKIPDLLRQAGELEAKDRQTFDKLFGMFMQSLLANTTVVAENDVASVFGKDVKATNLTVELNKENLAKTVEAFWTAVKNDADFKAALDGILPALNTLGMLAGNVLPTDPDGAPVGDVDLSEMPDLSNVKSADELYAALDPVITEAVAAIRQLPDLGATLKLALNKSGMIMRADLTVNVTGTTVVAVLELGEKLTSFEGFSFSVYMKMQGVTADLVTVKAEILEDSKTEYRLAMTASIGAGPTAESVIANLYLEKKTGKTLFQIRKPGEIKNIVSLYFTYTNKNGTHTFSDLKMEDSTGANVVPFKNFTLTIKEVDAMPECPAYTDVMSMTEAEVKALAERVQEKMAEMRRRLEPAEQEI